ncbi:MmgE/PrpD family protein [Alkalihalobacillus sp. 1P02AB]|uniref:MmgE/PrpD family protein n=1 Tax=Alkalihalobacillus sp. 1P02AB TaxID=3132260 RepID=UPI0039A5A680
MPKSLTDMLRNVLDYDDFTSNTIERTKWVILDSLAAVLQSVSSESPIINFIKDVSKETPSTESCIPILGTNTFTTKINSAIIHGTAMVSNELDEGNQFAKGHPAAHILPAAYLSAIVNRSSGEDFIKAFILGYETSSRLAYATNMKDYMHPHGTWGNVGGAVAASILANKSKEDIIETALLAATLPIATTWQAAEKGVSARNLYTGIGSYLAYEALDLQSYGFRSSLSVVEDLWSHIMSNGFQHSRLFDELLTPPLIEKNYFKLYPSCRFTHSALDALQAILQESDLEPTDIEKIEVYTYSLASRCKTQQPKTPLEAKFSIPFMLATMLKGIDLYQINNESVLFDPSLLVLASKICVYEDKNLTSLLPEQRPARVVINLHNGKEHSATVFSAIGEHDQPFNENELLEKYNKMLNPFYSKQQISQLVTFTFALETYADFNYWLKDLTSGLGGK